MQTLPGVSSLLHFEGHFGFTSPELVMVPLQVCLTSG